MEEPKKVWKKVEQWMKLEANFQKFDKVEQVMKMKLRFSPFPTNKSILSTFFCDRQIFIYLFKPFLMMHNCFKRCFSYYVEGPVQNFKPKTFPYLIY